MGLFAEMARDLAQLQGQTYGHIPIMGDWGCALITEPIDDPTNEETAVLIAVGAPWAVSGLTQVAALAAMEDLPYMRETVAACGRARQSIVDGLKELGFVAYNTRANFIIWQVREPARAVQALVARDVYVSNKDSVPQMKGCLRVTVGNSAQSEQFLGIVQELRAKGLLEP